MAEMVLLGGSNRRMGSEREDGSEFGRGGGRPASRIPIDGRERRNVVRFELKEEQMERKEFSIEVLQKTLKFIPGEIDFLFAFPGKTTFEVVFKTRYLYDKCVRTVEREKEVNLILDKFLIVPLSDRLDKKVNVIMYTEKVKIQDISTWLLQYCDVKTSMQMTDDDGIKNGLYKFDIILKKERDTDRVIHLPPVIQIGAVRGHVFYPGQPQVCRRCGKEGHKVLECIVVKCRNCKEEGHSTRECRKQIICNLCGQEAHAFKDCPVSYANIVKVNKTDKVIALLDEESEEEMEGEERQREEKLGGERRTNGKEDPESTTGKMEEEKEEVKSCGESDVWNFMEDKTEKDSAESRIDQYSQDILFHTEEIMEILSGTASVCQSPAKEMVENIVQEKMREEMGEMKINPTLQRKRGPDLLSPGNSGKVEEMEKICQEWGTTPSFLETKDMEGFLSTTGMKGVEEWKVERKGTKKAKKNAAGVNKGRIEGEVEKNTGKKK
ncbi:zinc finger CCHC domain-containing protein 3 [Erpetoichthys calabaricus]|uniref:zinc finger CCHC domain-containing protein 3 n=1 Tax=Erpetoichthys calabaricus TaxID=27687 RepID=UPI00223411DB|nr:zinc finger CCHC domain-containing protein 3 [Erpetoichthys calabaricus]